MRKLGALVALGFATHAWSTRNRLRIPTLPGYEGPLPADGTAAPPVVVLRAPGVWVGPRTVLAAAAYAAANELDVVDLVPADLPVADIIQLSGMVDPNNYRANRHAQGRSALQATVVTTRMLDRVCCLDGRLSDQPAKAAGGARGASATAELAGSVQVDGSVDGPGVPEIVLDQGTYVLAVAELKAGSATGCDLVVVPELRAAPREAADRAALLDRTAGHFSAAMLGWRAVTAAVVGWGLWRRRRWAGVAAAVYSAEPAIAVAGSGFRPRGMASDALLRWARGPLDLARQVASTPHLVDPEAATATREDYRALLAKGTEQFFEPRQEGCPWCGGRALEGVLDVGDLFQHKPGRFHLDQCLACGHIFQNPRLSLEGLSFYYRDFYDGLGEQLMAGVFRTSGNAHKGRADLVARHVAEEPQTWLDVGAGHGHFCWEARQWFPSTTFDGLDLGEAVEEAVRHGWIDHAYRGLFPEKAQEIAGRYDVVSMHHYLEHTTEPRDELAAAAVAVHPGGYLLIEVPDPECFLRPAIGSRWIPYLQPQHLNLMPSGNLAAAVEEAGFDVVEVELAWANQHNDIAGAALMEYWARAPVPGLPWRPEPGPLARLRPMACALPVLPLGFLGGIVDTAIGASFGRKRHANAYRILARRR